MTTPPTMTQTDANISKLCDAVMRGFAAALNYKVADIDRAIAIMRAETKALFFKERYKDAREAVMLGSLNERYVVGLVVAECVAQYARG